MPQQEALKVKEANKEAILARPNVVGVGVGYRRVNGLPTGEVSVVVMVRQKLPLSDLPASAVLPRQLERVDVDVVQVGELRALQVRTGRWRPAPGGVSLGHYKITAGTFGAVVRDRNTDARMILSNNHVLANSNEAAPGDSILQPGPYDGGQEGADTIAHLERFCPLVFTSTPGNCALANAYAGLGNALAGLLGSKHRLEVIETNLQAVNQVDAALARPLDDAAILDEILDIGAVSGTVAPALGMRVRKSGRTTGFTTGEITILNATVNVSYGAERNARFENQIVSGAMSQGGDSGSLLVAAEAPQAVGLLFAGSNQATIYNPIQAVLDCLEVTL